jgi:RNA polymerase sigma-70 factor (ECF subfamily)
LPVEESLAELLRDARRGPPAAFDRLARRVQPLVRRWALVRTGDADRADDVVQRVLIGLHGGLDGFRGDSRLETWLYRITMNEAATQERERARRAVPVENVPDRAAGERDESGDRIDGLYARGVAELVRSFFLELPDRQRQVFSLVDLEGRAASEVADMLDLSPSTVRVTLLRARRAVRSRILELHPELEGGYGRGV